MLNDLNLPSVLSIAGTDPSGGAGIQADIKAISATGSYAASVITVLVAQNTQGVRAIQEIPLDFIQQQMDAVFTDLQFAAVKLGMLYSQDIIECVAKNLKKYQPPLIVLDPVMTAQSGDLLLKPNTIKALISLFPLVTLITPNIPEAEILLNKKINNKKEMEAAAIELAETHQTSVLLKGGHLTSSDSPDIFYDPRQAKIDSQQLDFRQGAAKMSNRNVYNIHEDCELSGNTAKNSSAKSIICFDSPRIDTPHTHGTGCTLSSAIASYLAQGYTLYDAIHKAKTYLQQAIAAGKNLRIGKGSGPVHHFYYLKKANHVIQ